MLTKKVEALTAVMEYLEARVEVREVLLRRLRQRANRFRHLESRPQDMALQIGTRRVMRPLKEEIDRRQKIQDQLLADLRQATVDVAQAMAEG